MFWRQTIWSVSPCNGVLFHKSKGTNISINGGCSLYGPVLILGGCIHNEGYLNGVALQSEPVLGPKKARAAGQPYSNTPSYGYSRLESIPYRAI